MRIVPVLRDGGGPRGLSGDSTLKSEPPIVSIDSPASGAACGRPCRSHDRHDHRQKFSSRSAVDVTWSVGGNKVCDGAVVRLADHHNTTVLNGVRRRSPSRRSTRTAVLQLRDRSRSRRTTPTAESSLPRMAVFCQPADRGRVADVSRRGPHGRVKIVVGRGSAVLFSFRWGTSDTVYLSAGSCNADGDGLHRPHRLRHRRSRCSWGANTTSSRRPPATR